MVLLLPPKFHRPQSTTVLFTIRKNLSLLLHLRLPQRPPKLQSCPNFLHFKMKLRLGIYTSFRPKKKIIFEPTCYLCIFYFYFLWADIYIFIFNLFWMSWLHKIEVWLFIFIISFLFCHTNLPPQWSSQIRVCCMFVHKLVKFFLSFCIPILSHKPFLRVILCHIIGVCFQSQPFMVIMSFIKP